MACADVGTLGELESLTALIGWISRTTRIDKKKRARPSSRMDFCLLLARQGSHLAQKSAGLTFNIRPAEEWLTYSCHDPSGFAATFASWIGLRRNENIHTSHEASK